MIGRWITSTPLHIRGARSLQLRLPIRSFASKPDAAPPSDASKDASKDASTDTSVPKTAATPPPAAESKPSAVGNLWRGFGRATRYVYDAIVGNERRDWSSRNAAIRPLPADMPASDSTALAVFQKPMSPWEKNWREKKERLEQSALYLALESGIKGTIRRVVQSENVVIKSAVDAHRSAKHKIEDIREEFETSQDPSIVRARELSDSFFSESETGAAVGEVRKTDPDFSIRELEMEMQEYMLPLTMKSYLATDIKFMRTFMEDNAMRFVMAEHKQREALGHKPDFFLITLDAVQCASASFQQHIPIFTLNFAMQYRHMIRDQAGNIVEGSESTLKTGGGVVIVRRDLESDVFNWKIVDLRTWHHQALL